MQPRQIDVDGASYCLLSVDGGPRVFTYDVVGPHGERLHVTLPFSRSDDDGIRDMIRSYRTGHIGARMVRP